MKGCYGSRKIVTLALAARFGGVLTKPPLNAQTLAAHIYGDRGVSSPLKSTQRALPLIPPEVVPLIQFKIKRGGAWVPLPREQALKCKTRLGLRFAIPAENVPDIIARHEARQGGRDDRSNVIAEIRRIAQKSYSG